MFIQAINQYVVINFCSWFVQLVSWKKSYFCQKVKWTWNKKYNCRGPPAFTCQRVGYQPNQNLLHHYQHSKNLIHKFILKIQQILGSHELKGHGNFLSRSPKNHWINFLPFWICISMQKISYSIYSFLRLPITRLVTTISDHAHPKIFNHLLICMNLYQHAKNQLIPKVHSWDTINFRVQRPNWPHLFLTMPNQKIFN